MKNGSPNEKKHFSYEWAFYEISIFKNDITEREVKEILKQIPYESLSILEAHYLSNNCFLEENYIFNNIGQIAHIPSKMIHGKDDAICPLKFAIELDEMSINSTLFIREGGHSDSELDIEKTLTEILNLSEW